VLSDIPTYRELWDGAALFFAPGDAAGLAAAANRLIAEPDLRARLGAAARARAARYTLEAQVDAMDAIYERVRARRFATTEAG
jgi:glycosyltransferase involved in cell wall biosynthesis